MPRVIHHPHPAHAHHHHTALYIGIGTLVVLAAILAVMFAPTIVVRDRAEFAVAVSAPYPDYAQRHPELILPMPAAPIDTTDYYFRHIDLNARIDTDDQTDYIFRHPELINP